MRVGLFLLLSAVVHLAAGQWLDWRMPSTISSPVAAEQGRALTLPTLLRVAPAQLPEREVELVEMTEASPAPVVPRVTKQAGPTAPDPAPQTPPVTVKPVVEPPVKTPLVEQSPSQQRAAPTTQTTVTATAPRSSPQLQERSLPVEPMEVVSQAPRFREPPAAPVYPAQARRRNQQGQVLVEVRLDTTGKQRELRLVQSSGFNSLDQAALEAVADWKFEPEVQAGQAMPSRVQIPIDFALNRRR